MCGTFRTLRIGRFFAAWLVLWSLSVADETSRPIQWTFEADSPFPGDVHGHAKITDSELKPPRYPSFRPSNSVLELKSPSWLRLVDDANDERFDFDVGDAATFEAWVRIDSMGENVYIVGKGRTETTGTKAINQNWAFRLRRHNGKACVNFLFRSRKTDDHPGDWHRWTSKTGFQSGSRWHHVAVSYRFGEPKSIRGYIDGREVKGDWDMGGATARPPVIDNDDVWIGSTMGGNKGNSLHGALDNVTIHRRAVAAEELKLRFQWNPPPIKTPTIPKDKVVLQLFGSLDSEKNIPQETGPPLTEWHQDEFGFVRLPHNYDAWGVRDDWGKTLLVRAWADVRLDAGDYRLMVRSRGRARLKIDGKEQLTTRTQPNRGGAHHVVDELPTAPVPGMRPHAMTDDEQIVAFRSEGKTHRVLLEIIIGGPRFRTEFGETCLAIADSDGMFFLLSNTSHYPLTDDGWLSFVDDCSAALAARDTATRRAANQTKAGYWDRRHAHAKTTLQRNPKRQNIDDIIAKEIAAKNQQAAQRASQSSQADSSEFTAHIQPLFDAHCVRCHGHKEQGGLSLSDRRRLLEGGESGQAAVVPGDAEASYLYQLVSASADEYRMPPKGDGLSTAELKSLQTWIANGAHMPAGPTEVIEQPAITDDATFLRRVFIDTVGVPPSLAEANAFLRDEAPDRRSRLIDRLLSDDRWADNWVGYWQDVFAENPNLLKPTLNNTGPFRYWIHEAVFDNKSLDRFATELMLMRGSTWSGGSAGFSVASQNDVPMAAKAHVIGTAFLGVDMKCARCHDAPYHAWKQSDLFQLAAMLDRKSLQLPHTSTVPVAFFDQQERKPLIEVSLKAGTAIDAHFPFAELTPLIDDALLENPQDTREQLAVQVTASRRFAEVQANRFWKRFMGKGLVEPVDDWEGNPPSNAALLSALTDRLISVDYNLKEFARGIFKSSVYQRRALNTPAGRNRSFAGPYRRRMSAEQIVDSAFHVVGAQMQTEQLTLDIEGTLPPNQFLNFGHPQRSWEFTTLANERDRPSLALPQAQAIVDILKAFGWRNARPEPQTDREESPNLIQPGVLANGTLAVWLTRLTDGGGLTTLMREEQPVEQLVDDLFLSILTRLPTGVERKHFTEFLTPGYDQRIVPENEIGTAPEPRRFRYVSWSNHLNTEANSIKMDMQDWVRQGPPATRYLRSSWQERATDAVWAMLNSPEMILIP